jgi:hypothetical protein
MKKLLSILGSFGIIASSASSLVSCSVPTQSLKTKIMGKDATDDVINNFRLPSMAGDSDNPLNSIGMGLLNVLAAGGDKVEDASDKAMLGDAEKLSINNNLYNDDQKIYTGDWNAFKEAYVSSGNSRFTSVDYEKVAMDGDSAEDNLYGQQLGIVKDATEPSLTLTLTSDVENLTTLISNAGEGELKTNIEKFKGKHLPYGSYLGKPTEKPTFTVKGYTDDEANKFKALAISEKDYKEKGLTINARLNPHDETVIEYANTSQEIYQQVNDIEVKFEFQTEKGKSFTLDVTGITCYLMYGLGIMTDGFNATDDMKAFLVVLPSAYTFTHDVANPTTNVFESLVTNQEKLKIDIRENK